MVVAIRADLAQDNSAVNGTAEANQNVLRSRPKPLGRSWSKAKDTQQYAEKLTKYADQPGAYEQDIQAEMPTPGAGYYLLTSPPKRRITASPPPFIQTTVWKSGSSEIIMRKFEPVDTDASSTPSHLRPLEGVREHDEFFYRVSNVPERSTYEDDYRATVPQPELSAIADRKQAP
ncbi:hypothetical protein MSG28_010374 [Choristoneura fumiferana]|uniref:Uncharacterized protein n=1 Tax=Choristoneura fumiferana TaxID=7141 RepID=A0ACC0KLE3_CHOFU|nr:hypothetical protein MSG28_010374 [Choristoneura fumiferana]